MIRHGQFSLGYLILQMFWIAIMVWFGRHMFVYFSDVTSPAAPFIGFCAMCGTFFFASVVVGGFFKSMRGGALVGSAVVIAMLVILLISFATFRG